MGIRTDTSTARQRALALVRRGKLAAARPLLEDIVRTKRDDVESWNLLGTVHHRLGDRASAARCYEAMIGLNPARADAYYFLGNVRGEGGDHEAALACFRRALELSPQSPEAARNLGATLQILGRTTEAVDCYRRFLAQGPGGAEIHFNLANALADLGAYDEAIAEYRRALALRPDWADACVNLGNTLDERGDPELAAQQYVKALSLDSGSLAAYRGLGAVLAALGKTDEAVACYRQALSIAPDAGLELRSAMTLPVVPASSADIQKWRGRFESELACLEQRELRLENPLSEIGATNFHLSYHGLANRDLHARVARLYRRACPSLDWTAPHCKEPKRPAGKIRVGFVSRHLHNHSIGKTTRGIMANLSRGRFEVIALFVPPLRDDEISRFIRSKSDRFAVLPATLDGARCAIAELRLDVLFYQDIGLEPFTYFLAFSRLAPVQCTSFGHPDTTGIDSMDYFVSSDLFEAPAAERHYSEQLFQLHDLGTLAYYYRPETPPALKRREDFGLPSAGKLYLCPQALFKLHPDFDVILADILRRDPSAHLVLIEGGARTWGELLRVRFGRTFSDVAARVLFLPRQSGADFTNLIAVCDVMLDTPQFNGMNTSLEALSVGTPVITLPGELQRTRHTAAMYRKMGFSGLVAQDADDYVRIALGANAREVRQELLRRSGVLFEDLRVVREFERFFTEASGA